LFVYLSTISIMYSTLLMILIALDRYFVICHPFKRIMTIFRAKFITFVLLVFVGSESIIATVSQDVWNDCLTLLESSEICHKDLVSLNFPSTMRGKCRIMTRCDDKMGMTMTND
jgi:hypothetical protein